MRAPARNSSRMLLSDENVELGLTAEKKNSQAGGDGSNQIDFTAPRGAMTRNSLSKSHLVVRLLKATKLSSIGIWTSGPAMAFTRAASGPKVEKASANEIALFLAVVLRVSATASA